MERGEQRRRYNPRERRVRQRGNTRRIDDTHTGRRHYQYQRFNKFRDEQAQNSNKRVERRDLGKQEEQKKHSSNKEHQSKQPKHKKFDSSDTDSDVEKLRNDIKDLFKSKINATDEVPKLQPILKKEREDDKQKSSSSSSTDSEDERRIEVNARNVKKECISEDDVVCLGNIEVTEKLQKRTSGCGASELCVLCEKEGHTAFYCFMTCSNCGAKYHGLKDCPRPPNSSTVLQKFMEFCLNQCRRYNPEEKFDFDAEFYMNGVTKIKTTDATQSRCLRRRRSSSDSEDRYTGSSSKKRKHHQTNTDSTASNSFNQYPCNYAFSSPFPFGSQGSTFNTQGGPMNAMLSLAQLIGLNAFNCASNR